MSAQQLISIVVPVYNEEPNIPVLHSEIVKHVSGLPYSFEFVFVDDGSRDGSAAAIQKLAKKRRSVRLIELSRNFGKEAAVSAGLHAAKGDAAIILDADLQHPPSLIRKFIRKWKQGAEVVVGVKRYGKNESWFKRFSSAWFYRLIRPISNAEITPHAADYRLIDRRVIDAFSNLKEHNRMTRGLIDWLGFKRDYVTFEVSPRLHGERSYTYRKLFALAFNSFTAYSLLPLKLAGYLGNAILSITAPTGIFLWVEMYALHDPLNLNITSVGMMALLTLFLVGVILSCIGLVSLYIAHIYAEVVDRPLYVVRNDEQGFMSQPLSVQTRNQAPTSVISASPQPALTTATIPAKATTITATTTADAQIVKKPKRTRSKRARRSEHESIVA
jgi:dolichol-phosphate mannosyltransferase